MVAIGRRSFLVWLVSCGIPGRATAEPKQLKKGQMDQQQLKFFSKVGIEDGKLVVQYGIDNQSSVDVYLLNRVQNRRLQISPDFAYIELQEQNRTVVVSKKIPEIPAGLNPTMPEAPYVTPVGAGKRFAETVHIEVPIHEYRAYDPRPVDSIHEHPATYTGVQIRIGYYWSVPGMKENRQMVSGSEVILPKPPPGTRLQFNELSSVVMPLQIAVVERK